jgi:predicted RecB family nuclease
LSNLAGHVGASIEWYDRFVETGDRALLQRILDYNEDDCRAMIVLLTVTDYWTLRQKALLQFRPYVQEPN